MEALILRFVLIVNFQVIMAAARGITIPLNTATTKIESFKCLPKKSTELEDPPKIEDVFISTEPHTYFKSVEFPSLPNVIIPIIENSLNIAQSYDEECVIKYSRYNNMAVLPKTGFECDSEFPKYLHNPNLFVPNLSIDESIKPVSNFIPSASFGLKLPLKVSSSVKSLGDKVVSSLPYTKFDSPISLSSVAKSNPEIIFPPPLSCCVTSEPSKSTVDLAKSMELSNSQFISPSTAIPFSTLPLPVSSSSIAVTELLNLENIGASSCSTFSLPFSVASTSKSMESSQFSSSPFSSNYTQTPMLSSCSNSFPSQFIKSSHILSPNTLPKPLIPLSVPDSQGFRTSLSSSCCSTYCPLMSNPVRASNQTYFSFPSLTTTELMPIQDYANKSPKMPNSGLTNAVAIKSQDAWNTTPSNNLINSPILDIKFASTTSSSIYKYCHTLKPLLFSYNNAPSLLNTLSPPNISLQNKVSYGLSPISPFSYRPLSIKEISHTSFDLPESENAYCLELTKPSYDLPNGNTLLTSSYRTLVTPEFDSSYESISSLNMPSYLSPASNSLLPMANVPIQ